LPGPAYALCAKPGAKTRKVPGAWSPGCWPKLLPRPGGPGKGRPKVSKWRVKIVPMRDPRKVMKVLQSLRRLCDRDYDDLLPSEFWTEGTYQPHPRWVNAYLFLLNPLPDMDWVSQARHMARVLEGGQGVELDWAAGVRKSGQVWMVVKVLAWKGKRRVRWHPKQEDIEALVCMYPSRSRERERERMR